jgi:hypothetical protein
MQGSNRSIRRSIKRGLARAKLLYGLGEWKMEDWVNLLKTEGVSLSL